MKKSFFARSFFSTGHAIARLLLVPNHWVLRFRLISVFAFGLLSSALFGQVTAGQVDRIASRILTKNGINLRGEIRADFYRANGFAATSGTSSYSIIYVDPHKLRTLSANTWAFIVGHELAHQYLRHSPRDQSVENEFAADRVGAYWAWKAGYDVVDYLAYMATEPDVCTPSHGCWHDRIRNIRAMFGLSYAAQCD